MRKLLLKDGQKNTKENMQMINKILCAVLLLALFISCTDTPTKNNVSDGIVITPDVPPKEELIDDILTYGNIDSYNSLVFYYPNDIDVLPMAVYMAEHYGYGKAYSDLFCTCYSTFKENSISIDSATQKYMLYYLQKGVEQKDTDCIWIMSKVYWNGWGIRKDTVKAKELLMQIVPSDDFEKMYWPYLKKHSSI